MIRRLADLWWGQIPALASNLWGALGIVLRDGEYIESVPVAAALAVPAAAAVGILGGWVHPFASDLYTTAPLLLAIALAAGTVSAALGAWLTLGYAVGSLLAAQPAGFTGTFGNDVKTYAALMLADIVLAMLVMIIPLTARALATEVAARWMPGRGEAPALVIALLAGIGLVFAWAHAALVMTRPYFVWHGQATPVTESDALHLSAVILPLVFVAALLVRALLEVKARALATPRPAGELRTKGARLPQPVALIVRVGFAVFLLAGLMDSWVDAILVAVAMGVLLVLREPALRRFDEHLAIVVRVPILPRLALGSVISAVVAILIVGVFGADGVVRPVVVSTLVSLIVFSVLLPDSVITGEHRSPAIASSAPPPPPPPLPPPAAQAVGA